MSGQIAQVLTFPSAALISKFVVRDGGPGALFQGFPDGQMAMDTSTGTVYSLQTSTATVDGSTVLYVMGDSTRRWIELTGDTPSSSCPVTLLPTTTVSVETDTVSYTVNGELGIYEFDIAAVCGTGCTVAGGSITCNLNDTTTNQQCQSEHISGTGTPAHAAFGNATKAVVGLEAAVGQTTISHVRIYTKAGTVRVMKWHNSIFDATANAVQTFVGSSYWNDTSTPVTKITFKDATNKYFGVGSTVMARYYNLS